MSNKFLENIDMILESSNNMSLKILLEEDDWADAFGDNDKKKKKKKSKDSSEDEEEESDSDDLDLSVEDEEEESEEESEEDEEHKAIDILADLRSNVEQGKIIDNETDRMISKYQVNPSNSIKLVSNKVISYDSIEKFIILEKDSPSEKEDIQNVLNSFQDQIEDMESVSFKGLKGKESGTLINISAEVENALHQVKYFDKLFKPSEIVHDWFVSLIAKTGPSDKKEDMIKQFQIQFDEKLPKEDKIGIQKDTTSYNAMAGAKPTA